MKQEMGRGGELVRFAWQSAAIAVAACGLVFAASRATAFTDLNSWTYDFTVLSGGDHTKSKDIVLVDFDEESFARIGAYPIPRGTIADLITKIAAQQPKIVGMDIFLSEARTPEEDKAMQAALSGAQTVVLASQSSNGVLPPVIPLPLFCQPENPRAASGYCADGTPPPGALGYAFVNMDFDQDGFIRQAVLIDTGPPRAESFPLFLAELYSGDAIKPVDETHASFLGHDVYFAKPRGNTMLIGSWERQPVPTISAWKLLAGQVPANAMTNKLVLIGQTNDAARDRLLSPVFRRAEPDGSRMRLGGTEIHAAAIRSLLEGKVVRPATPILRWSMVFLLAWASSFVLLSLRPLPGVACAIVFAICPCLLAVYLYAHWRFWLPFLPSQVGVELTLPLSLGLQFILERLVAHEAREQRKQLMKLFSSYVDPAVAKTIWERRSEVSLIGEERVATVVFTDIRNFTKMSAGRHPAEVLRWLNMYVTAMDQVIRNYDGFLNKFIGDGLMIIFGLPLSQGPSEDARLAIEASLAMLESVKQLNKMNASNPAIPQLRIGIGMHTGPLMAGSIGSASRQEYSVIGATVNLASRLESLNKTFKTEILMSKATHDMVAHDFAGLRSLGMSSVAGLEEQIEVFTVDPAGETRGRQVHGPAGTGRKGTQMDHVSELSAGKVLRKCSRWIAALTGAFGLALAAPAASAWGQQPTPPPKVVRVRAKLDGFDIAPTSGKAPNQIGGASRDLGALTLYAPKLGKAYSLTPTFNWSALDDKTEYTFKLSALSTQESVLYVKKVLGGRFTYPADAPPLKPSETYIWSVQPENDLMGGLAQASVLVVGGANRNAVASALADAKVTPGEPSAAAARIYVDNRLWFDAIAEYTSLIERHPEVAQYYKDRAAVYDQLQETRTLADEDAAKAQK